MSQQSLMRGANLAQILSGTLNPTTTHECFQILSEMKYTNGFAIQLLIITDNVNENISIRQSALVYLKNLLIQHCQKQEVVSQADLNTVKSSLLQALIRNVQNRMLTPTFRQIIYKMAEKYYPRNWSQIVDQAVKLLQTSGSLDELLGAVQTLKAIYSVFGGSISKQIQLNNLCNKSIIPILSLASKLFQNFNQQTSSVLVGIFKLLSTSIHFYLPKIIELNIHSFMIFVKKILDLNTDLSSNDNINLYLLKKISLRILFRLYQKHANFRITENKHFAQQFHMKYTRPFVQTLVLQTLLRVDGDKNSRHRAMQLIKLSFSSLAYINRQNPQAATLLLQHRDGMIKLSMDKFRVSLSKNYQSFNDYKLYNKQSRLHLKEFILSLIQCESIPQQQNEASSTILSLLLEYLQKGDVEQKDLALHIFAQISTPLKYLRQSLDQKLIALLLNYVQPLLKEDQHQLIRARACQMIGSYHHLELPEDQIKDMAMLIYGCLLVGTSEKQTILKIYACNAFNSLMKYQNIVEFIRPYLQDILRIYTSLLEADASIIKNFEDLINILQEEIAPYANDLAGMLINMFMNYTSDNPQINQQGYQTLQRQENGDQEQQDQYVDDQEDNNNEYNARACISTIRQVLQVNNAMISQITQKKLLDIVVWIFSDTNQNYIEQGYNILNLILYKMQNQVHSDFFLFFKVIVYAILGLPPNYIEDLNRRDDGFSLKFAQILSNICVDPDDDIIQNSIGCLRNFIVKSNGNFLRNEKDELNISLMDYILKLVMFVHQNVNNKASQTERLIILTLYITVIQYQVVNQLQLNQIVSKVTTWMQMQHQKVQEERAKENNNGFSTFGKNVSSVKYIYTPIYLQILILAVNFYTNDIQINIENIVDRVVAFADYFKCDYELSRVTVGLSHILNNKLVLNENLLRSLLNCLPQMVRRLCQLRQEGDSPENDLEMDDEAEEQQLFGDDQNTHMLGWQGSKPTEKDMMLKKDSQEEEDHDWQEQFNKFYQSPLDKLDELKFLELALSTNAQIYSPYMTPLNQTNLSMYLANAPPKL